MFWMLVVSRCSASSWQRLTWRTLTMHVLGWVLVVAFAAPSHFHCMARAMRHADATVVVPMDFLRVPLTALAGWALYAERLDLMTVAGAGLIRWQPLNLRQLRTPR